MEGGKGGKGRKRKGQGNKVSPDKSSHLEHWINNGMDFLLCLSTLCHFKNMARKRHRSVVK